MPDPKNPPAFGDDDDEKTGHSNPGDLPFTPLDAEDDRTEYSNPKKDLPFKPAGLSDEDDEATVMAPPPPSKKR
jgi:hypothetical protein